MNRPNSGVLLFFLILLPSGMLHAQAPTGGPAGGTPPAAAATSAVVEVKPSESAKPAAASTPLETAEQLYRSGKADEAGTAYKAILQNDPKSVDAYVGLARVHLKQKRVSDAEDALAKAVELDPKSNKVKVALGEVRFREGRINEAQDYFTPLVKANAPEARAYLGLGKIYWAASQRLHGKLMYEMAHEKDPQDPDVRRAWMFTLSRKERIEALKGFLSEEADEDQDDKNHLESALAAMQEAEVERRTGCHLENTPAEVHIQMEQLRNGPERITGYGLKVALNGVKSTLVVDTGSTGILVSKRLAEKAGIQSIVRTDIHGIGDKTAPGGFVGVADSIKIGELEFKGCHIEVVERNSVQEDDGLIGADLFSHYLVGIDFPNSKLNLSALPALPPLSDAEKALVAKYPKLAGFRDRYTAPEMKEYTPILRFGHMLLIPTGVNDMPLRLFLLDTGAFSDTISPAAAKEVTKVRGESRIQVKGLNGAVKDVFTADNLTLRFSHFRQPASNMIAFDTTGLSNSAGVEISGMLGFAMLYRMSVMIDYRDGLVDFGYDAKRWH